MIRTQRLRLIPASIETLTAELSGRESFECSLGIPVPENWPPELYDRAATEYSYECLKSNPEHSGWGVYYIILDNGNGSVAVGTAGYKGPPDAEGSVEIGYGILPEFQRRGIATETAKGLIHNAFQHTDVRRVYAETLPELTASIGVMVKCGFRFIGEGSEPGVIRYELTREEHEKIHLNN